jgi:hypothetical protein
MKQMVLLVLNDPKFCMSLLEAWETAGVSGITILESTGLVRMRRMGVKDNLPIIPRLFDFVKSEESHHRTIFSVAEDEAQVEVIVAATNKAFDKMRDMGVENSAVMFVLPVSEMHRFNTEEQSS